MWNNIISQASNYSRILLEFIIFLQQLRWQLDEQIVVEVEKLVQHLS